MFYAGGIPLFVDEEELRDYRGPGVVAWEPFKGRITRLIEGDYSSVTFDKTGRSAVLKTLDGKLELVELAAPDYRK